MSFITLTDLVEDTTVEDILRNQEIDAAIAAAPVNLRTGRDHSPDDANNGVAYQKCGGGRRVIRKTVGN